MFRSGDLHIPSTDKWHYIITLLLVVLCVAEDEKLYFLSPQFGGGGLVMGDCWVEFISLGP